MAAVDGHLAALMHGSPRVNEWQLCGSGVFIEDVGKTFAMKETSLGNGFERRDGDMFGVAMTV